ncbi:hypothetical protein GCM10009678_45960 [Actinomadura kijaniata]
MCRPHLQAGSYPLVWRWTPATGTEFARGRSGHRFPRARIQKGSRSAAAIDAAVIAAAVTAATPASTVHRPTW